MRLSTDPGFNRDEAVDTLVAAAGAGITVFDTAHAYGRDAQDFGANEKLLVRALRAAGVDRRARVLAKGGMAPGGDPWGAAGRPRPMPAGPGAGPAPPHGPHTPPYPAHPPHP